MRNTIVIITFVIILVLSIITEPIDDVIDTIAGSTNSTYALTIDSFAGVSSEREDDDEEDDDEEDENEDEEDDD